MTEVFDIPRFVNANMRRRMKVTRIYVVDKRIGPSEARLVRAENPSQAIRHVTRGLFDAGVASQDDLVELIAKGIAVEDANPDVPTT